MPLINISDIDVEASVQVRAEINSDTVKEYAEHITDKRPPLPPIIVFGPDSRNKYYLSEGWHRLAAHKQAGRTAIQANIREGGWKDALEHALGSNAQHGLRRTNADKRRSVELALKHWAEWSNGVIADKCAVSREMVGDIRPRQVSDSDTCPGPVIGKDGKKYRPPPVRQVSDSDTCAGSMKGSPTDDQVSDSDTCPEQNRPKHAENSLPPPKKQVPPPLPTDQLGQTVLPHLLSLWERRHEVKAFLDQLSRISKRLELARDDRDPLFFGAEQGQTPINFSSALTHLQQARNAIKEAMPFAVCPMCQGSGCRCCSGNGLISKFRYDTIIPAEKKVKS